MSRVCVDSSQIMWKKFYGVWQLSSDSNQIESNCVFNVADASFHLTARGFTDAPFSLPDFLGHQGLYLQRFSNNPVFFFLCLHPNIAANAGILFL